MIKKIALGLALVASVGFMTSCSCSGNSSTSDFDMSGDSISGAPLQFSENVVNNMIQNISSPVEMANQIKNSGAGFSQAVLNSTDNISNYNTSFKRALNLGAYSADLGYINTFNKNTVVVSYLVAVKDLADGLNVGQFLDFQTLKRLATNSSNLDSLKQLSVSSFNRMDNYLRDQRRSNVSTAIVAGAWLEGIYITASVIEQTKDEKLVSRLGEQKEIVNILSLVLDNYSKSDKNFQDFTAKIEKIKNLYSNVSVKTEILSPETVEIDGMLTIVQKDIVHVEITPEQVAEIIAAIKEARDFMIN
ncbi:MAG: hypothetical protein MJZ01_02950 [Bacteroidales bacterium]|nr:hypothetical protein [Bacteroidales bacterium]